MYCAAKEDVLSASNDFKVYSSSNSFPKQKNMRTAQLDTGAMRYQNKCRDIISGPGAHEHHTQFQPNR